MSPVEAVAGMLAVRDAQAAKPPFTPTVEALTAEVQTAVPDDPEVTAPLIEAVRSIKEVRPNLAVKATADRHFLFIQVPRSTKGRRNE